MKVLNLIVSLTLLLTTQIASAAKVGEAAPDFTGNTAQGKAVTLSSLKGKYVVLEWHNPECPYVEAQYDSKHMQKTQEDWTKKGVAWLTVNSSAPGKQGAMDAKAALKDIKKHGAAPTLAVLDPSGVIGHAYDAKTTPNMFIIDPNGKLIYSGAIDDHQTSDAKDVGGKINYVTAALNEAMAGKPVSKPVTAPYGCSVKY